MGVGIGEGILKEERLAEAGEERHLDFTNEAQKELKELKEGTEEGSALRVGRVGVSGEGRKEGRGGDRDSSSVGKLEKNVECKRTASLHSQCANA